jgi:hypothetical protein
MLQECYKGVTTALQQHYKGVTKALQECYKGVTSILCLGIASSFAFTSFFLFFSLLVRSAGMLILQTVSVTVSKLLVRCPMLVVC